jgi:hypothetical protein
MWRSRLLIGVDVAFGLAIASSASADPIQVAPQKIPDTFLNYETTGIISPIAVYNTGKIRWVTATMPLGFESASLLEAEGNENPYLQALNNFGGGWTYTFNTTATIADNTFQVHTYQAQAPQPPAANNLAYRKGADSGSAGDAGCVESNNCTGAEFYVRYNPTGDDPTKNVHWIQVIDDGGDFTVDAGVVINIVKGKPMVVLAPYYDDGMHTANATGFLDFPTNFNAHTPSTFSAELFLVTGPAIDTPALVTIYGAINWGWSNQPMPLNVPEPATVFLFVAGLPLVYIAHWRSRRQRRA